LAKNLISYCGGVDQVFKAKRTQLMKIPGIGEKIANSVVSFKAFEKAEQEVGFIEKHKVKPLFYLHDNYPSRLKQVEDAPVMLYYLGNGDLNNAKIVGIVGTRKASDYGKTCTEELINGLAETGCLILSGLAFGIDIQAHRSALKYNLPTVGVLAHGLDRIYPAIHTATAKKMIDNGGLLTEFMSGSIPDRENFPKRNRIVAALCDVLVVVETAERGGAMITAELANGYNKDVASFPGRVNDEYSKGCNKLIKANKATLVTNTEDLYYLMGWNSSKPIPKIQQSLPLDLSMDDLAIYEFIKSKTKVAIDEIAFFFQVDSSNLSLQLLEMEFKGHIRTLPGKVYELI